jgi:hypothetical protein
MYMTPAQIKYISFFDDKVIEDQEDREFIHNLSWKNVSEDLTDDAAARLFLIYDEYAPDSEDWEHITRLVQTLKDIEYLQISFIKSNGEPAFESTTVIPD